jgi:hypothetical protein
MAGAKRNKGMRPAGFPALEALLRSKPNLTFRDAQPDLKRLYPNGAPSDATFYKLRAKVRLEDELKSNGLFVPKNDTPLESAFGSEPSYAPVPNVKHIDVNIHAPENKNETARFHFDIFVSALEAGDLEWAQKAQAALRRRGFHVVYKLNGEGDSNG